MLLRVLVVVVVKVMMMMRQMQVTLSDCLHLFNYYSYNYLSRRCCRADGFSQCRSCTLKYNADQNSRGVPRGGSGVIPRGIRGWVRGGSGWGSDRDPRAIRVGFGGSA